LWHKCKDADEKPYDKPRGYLLGDQKILPRAVFGGIALRR
jgi:hypothetical protein